MFYICEVSFVGNKEVFSSDNRKEVVEHLIELKAYNQPLMRDGGYMLCTKDDIIDIDDFVEKIRREE